MSIVMHGICQTLLLLLISTLAVVRAEEQAAAAEGYRLYPGDLIAISVFDNPELSVRLRIPSSGTVSMPLIGDIPGVVGMTVDRFTAVIRQGLERDYLRQAVVTATIEEFGPRRAAVLGSVAVPTVLQLHPYAPVTASHAIAQANGFTEGADRSAAVLIREHAGVRIVIPVPDLDRPEGVREDVTLMPDDVLLVPALDRIYIVGQVQHPGVINIPSREALTVSKAVAIAGGFARFAKETEVQVIRDGASLGVIDVRAVLAGGQGAKDVVLRPGDTVYVPESRF